MKQIDWQLPGATDCHGDKYMHSFCQSTGSWGLVAAASAKGRVGTRGMVPAAAGEFGYSWVCSDCPQLASGAQCCTSPVSGGWARDPSKTWCAPWHHSVCPLTELAAAWKSVSSVPIAPLLPCRFSWMVMALNFPPPFYFSGEFWHFQIIVSHLSTQMKGNVTKFICRHKDHKGILHQEGSFGVSNSYFVITGTTI